MVSFNKLSQYGLPFQLKVINQLLTNKNQSYVTESINKNQRAVIRDDVRAVSRYEYWREGN